MEDMTVQPKEPSGGASFEEVWAELRENDRETDRQLQKTSRMIEELYAKTDRMIKENAQQIKKTDRQMKETAQQIKETDRQLGKLGIRLGEISEYLMSPKLHKKFEALGFYFNHISRDHGLRDHNNQRLAEIDLLLENSEYALAVEVKTRPTVGDVKDHVRRMEILRRVADEHGDRRKYLGAVAGVVVTDGVLAYALKNGFYVIIPSGETVDIEAPEGFIPRIW
jgi:hypothetical protein